MSSAQTGQVFPDATFNHNIDMPFEVHRMIPRVTLMADGVFGVQLAPIDQPKIESLLALVKGKFDRIGGTITFTKASTLLRSLTKGVSELTWEWAEPDTIVRQEGYTVTLDTLTFPTFIAGVTQTLKVEICFEGFLLQLGAPSEQR